MALDLVSPQVPDAQSNRAADIFLQAMGTGLAAASRFAEMRRQSEMDVARLAEHERVSQETHDLEREKMAQDADYRAKALEVNRDLSGAHVRYFDAQADAWKNNKARGWQQQIEFNRRREALVNQVNDHARELKLDDPEFRAKEPVRFAANVMQFNDAWKFSDLPEVRHAVKNFQTLADQQKLPLRIGAKLKEGGEPSFQESWEGGETKPVPIYQIIEKLQDANTRDETMNALRASGHLKQEEQTVPGKPTRSIWRPIDSAWDFLIGPTPQKRTVEKPDAVLSNILDQGKDVQFEHVPSRVPPAMLPKSSAAGTSPTAMPAPDPDLPANLDEPQARATPTFEPTQTDRYIQQAKNAIAAGADRDAVADRLQQFGIDPSALLAA